MESKATFDIVSVSDIELNLDKVMEKIGMVLGEMAWTL
jgi:hypothetical protein